MVPAETADRIMKKLMRGISGGAQTINQHHPAAVMEQQPGAGEGRRPPRGQSWGGWRSRVVLRQWTEEGDGVGGAGGGRT